MNGLAAKISATADSGRSTVAVVEMAISEGSETLVEVRHSMGSDI